MNQEKTIAAILKKLVPEKGDSNAAVGRRLGISGQLLGQYIGGKKKPKADFYIKWKSEFGEDLMKLLETKVSERNNSDDSLLKIIARGQEQIAAAIKEQAEANKLQAQANKTSAENQQISMKTNERLVNEVIASRNAGNPATADANVTRLLGLLARIGSGEKWRTVEEAEAALSIEFYGPQKKGAKAGTHGN